MFKKGFVLVETIIVIIVTLVCILGLYKAYSYVILQLKNNRYYNDINDIYKLNIIKNTFNENLAISTKGYVKFNSDGCNLYMSLDCNQLLDILEINNSEINGNIIYTFNNMSDILSSYTDDTTSSLVPTDITFMNTLQSNYKYLILNYNDEEDNIHYAYVSMGGIE